MAHRVSTHDRRTVRPLIGAVAALSAVALAACGGGGSGTANGDPSGDGAATGRNVLELSGPPTETLRLGPEDFLGAEACSQPASCGFVSVAQSSPDGPVIAVVAVTTDPDQPPFFVIAGRPIGEGEGWTTAALEEPTYCIGGPGSERVACLVQGTSESGGATMWWEILDTDGGDTIYETEAREVTLAPVATQTPAAVYSLWITQEADGSFSGELESLGSDELGWTTATSFTFDEFSSWPGYVVPEGDAVVITETLHEGGRITIDPSSGKILEGRTGRAITDWSGRGLGRDGDSFLVGDTVLDTSELSGVPEFVWPYAWADGSAVPILMADDGGITAFDGDSGKPTWKLDVGLELLASCGDTLVLQSSDPADPGRLIAVGAEDGEGRWSVEGLVTDVRGAWCAGDDVVVQDGLVLLARSLDDGAETWAYDTGLDAAADGGTDGAEGAEGAEGATEAAAILTFSVRPMLQTGPDFAWWVVDGDGTTDMVVFVR